MAKGLGCAAAVLLLAMPTSAAGPAAGFGAPRTVGARPYPGGAVATAIDPAGDWIVAWAGTAGLEVSRDTGTPVLLTHGGPPPSAFALSMAPDGSAAIVLTQSVTQPLGVSTAPAGGPFGALQTSRATDVLAMNGRVVAIWDRGVTRGHGRVSYAIAPEGGRLGAPKALPASSSALRPQLIARPSLAAEQRGDVFLDYLTAPQSSPPQNSQLAGAMMAAGASSFGAPSVISGALGHGGVEQSSSYSSASSLFSGPGGIAATFVFATPTAWGMAATNATPTGFAPPAAAGTVRIPTRSGETMTLVGPAAALPASGGELVAWGATPTAAESGPPPSNGAVYVSVAPFATTRTLAAPAGQWPRDLLTAATTDRSIVLWTTLAGAPGYDRETLTYALHGQNGFTPAQRLGSNPLKPSTFSPDPVSLSAAGSHAIVAWGAGTSVEVALLNG